MTVRDLDLRLIRTTEAYKDALDRGDLEAADVLYAELDDLLDLRLHLPHPRLPSDRDGHTAPRAY